MSFEERLRRAVVRGKYLPHKAWRVTDWLYVVRSEKRPGVWYEVRVTPAGLSCGCEAGSFGNPCKHAARVWLRLLREYRPARLCDLPETPWDLWDGDEWGEGEEPVPPEGPDPWDWQPSWSEPQRAPARDSRDTSYYFAA